MLQVRSRIIHNGKTYEPDEIIEDIKNDEATRLVDLGVAFFVKTIPVSNDDTGKSGNTNIEDAEDLDKAYKADGLKEMATSIGMEFDEKITKTNLINQIIDEGRVDEFFTEEDA